MKPSLRTIIVDKASSPKGGVEFRDFEYGCANITINIYCKVNSLSVIVCC